MRFRKPSLKSALGITKAKRKIKKVSGIYKITRVMRAPVNFKRRELSHIGYYSLPMKVFRLLGRIFKRKN